MGILYVNTNARIVREHCVGQGSATLDNRAGVNMKDYFQTTYKFREMSSHVIIPMHGRINLWPKHMLCGYLWHRRAREAFILQCIQNEPQTLFDIVSKTKLWIPASFNIRLHVAHLNSQHRLPKFLLPWNAYMRTHKKSVPACTSTFERSDKYNFYYCFPNSFTSYLFSY